jgi:hypothetical protein
MHFDGFGPPEIAVDRGHLQSEHAGQQQVAVAPDAAGEETAVDGLQLGGLFQASG